jgi:hypothetical protein
VKKAWEHEDDKDELKIELQGLERQFWLGTEAGRLGCYDLSGETWRMGQHTKEKWVPAVSVFSCKINILWSNWAEKRKELTHYSQNWEQWLGHYRKSTYYTCVIVRQPWTRNQDG